jgi:hypothetical protein
MKLLKLEFQKSKLSSMPETERLFFIQATMLLNELSTLLRCFWLSYPNEKSNNEITDKALVFQKLFFSRTLAGKLYLGWELMEKLFFGHKLSIQYEPNLSEEGKEALTNLKRYFGKQNIIKTFRNKFSFHYELDSDAVITQLNTISESDLLEILIHESSINCKYFISDDIFTSAILAYSTETNDKLEALDKFLSEVAKVTAQFIIFLNACVAIMVKMYLGKNYIEIEIPEPEEITIPCFIKVESFELIDSKANHPA